MLVSCSAAFVASGPESTTLRLGSTKNRRHTTGITMFPIRAAGSRKVSISTSRRWAIRTPPRGAAPAVVR